MSASDDSGEPAKGQFLVYPAEDGRTKIAVRLEDETVWLTQQHMADLFQTTQQNISLHLQNIYDEGELQRAATHKEYLSVRQEGSRQVKRSLQEGSVVKSFFTTSPDGKRYSTNLGNVGTRMAAIVADVLEAR